MNTKLDSRSKLAKIVKGLNEVDAQRLLAFAVGMDIGRKMSNQHPCNAEKSHKITQ